MFIIHIACTLSLCSGLFCHRTPGGACLFHPRSGFADGQLDDLLTLSREPEVPSTWERGNNVGGI